MMTEIDQNKEEIHTREDNPHVPNKNEAIPTDSNITKIINFSQYAIQPFRKYVGLSFIIGVISILTIIVIAADECRMCFGKLEDFKTAPDETNQKDLKKFWVYGKNVESGYLKNVFSTLSKLGYKNDPNATDWDLLWAHDYPFRTLYHRLSRMKPHQKVNHFPGCGYITNKVDLATSGLKYIPPAFKLPGDKGKFLDYATKNTNLTFVQKNNDHRNIKVKNIDDIDLDSDGTFIQEFVDKPLLVDGHKFDIGIYTIITSMDPLRIYIYNGDALLRFCPVKYYPFDPNNLDKYVVGDDYLPIWEVPSLDYYYNKLGFGMRESLNAYLESKELNPGIIWDNIEESIRTLVLAKEQKILEVISKFKSKRNFFEMMRIDFVLDENLNVYLLEANMSPNLSSAHFPPNQLLYEQVLYNMMGLLGLGERFRKSTIAIKSKSEEEILVSDKSLATFPKECNSQLCRSSCMSPVCQLCKPCLSTDTRSSLVEAHKEHSNRGECKRIFPPSLNPGMSVESEDLEHYSAENQLQYRWFLGKCQLDSSWC